MRGLIKFLRGKKADIFFILFFACVFILATQLMPHLAVSFSKQSGITVKADLLLASVISLGLLRGRKYASYFAVSFGFIFDIFIGNPYAFSPVVYFLCGYFASRAATPFSRKTPLSVLLISAMLLWIKAIVSLFYLIAVSSSKTPTATLILKGVLPEYIVNILAAAVIFAFMRILMAIFKIPLKEDILR